MKNNYLITLEVYVSQNSMDSACSLAEAVEEMVRKHTDVFSATAIQVERLDGKRKTIQ